MAQKYVQLSNTTAGSRSAGCDQARLQLSTGTDVWIEYDPSVTTYYLKYAPDHQNVNALATLSNLHTGAAANASVVALCRDASNNLYVVGVDSGVQADIRCVAFLKGTGNAWTAETQGTFNAAGATQRHLSVRWCNTGGGTNSAGHLLVAWQSTTTGAGVTKWGVTTLDAGALLAGTTTVVATTDGGSGDAGNAPDMEADGFGATSVLVAQVVSSTLTVHNVLVSSTGAITLSRVGHAPAVATAPKTRVVRYTSGQWAVVSDSTTHSGPIGSNAGHYMIWKCSTTSVGTGVDSGAPTNLPLHGTGTGWDAFCDPGGGKVWVIAPSAAATTSAIMRRLAWTTGGWATTVTTDDTLTNAHTTPTTVRACKQPTVSAVSWDASLKVSATDYALDGDFTSFGSAPNAPSLIKPANASYGSVATGQAFTAKYNSTDGANQNAYAFRIKKSTAATYSYYNASTNALQSTIVWNADSIAPNTTFGPTLPSTAISNGHTYQWSAASQESYSNLKGPFATTFSFSAQAGPTLVVEAPTGTVTTTNQPTVQWTATPGAGASITAYRVVVFTTAQHAVATFTPGTATHTWTSGTIAGNASTLQVGTPLSNSTKFYAYVQVTETGTVKSSWEYTTFTVSIDEPAKPTVSVSTATTATTTCPYIEVVVQCHTNILTATSASFENGVGKWSAGTNTTVSSAIPPVTAPDGTKALKLVPTAAGSLTASTKSGKTGFAVEPGAKYTVMAKVLASVDSRACKLTVDWYKSTGAASTSATVGTVTDATTDWTRIIGTVTVPTTAAYGQILITVATCSAPLAAPATPTVTAEGTTGSTTYSYKVTAGNTRGRTTPSTAGSTATGNATLSATDYNLVAWVADPLPAGSSGNLVYDSNLTNAIAAVGPTWSPAPGNSAVVGSADGDVNVLNAGTNTAAWVLYGTGATENTFRYKSSVFDVVAGATYKLSALIDATNATTGLGAFVQLVTPTVSTGYGSTIFQTDGHTGLVSESIIIPTGVTHVRIQIGFVGTATAGDTISWSQIQLTETAVVQNYAPGPLWTYDVYRDVSGTYELIGSTTALALKDTGQAASATQPPTVNTMEDIHWLDTVGIFPGTVTTWTAGGFVGTQKVIVKRSTTALFYVRGASTANRATVPAPTQKVTLKTFEVTPTVEYTYSAVTAVGTRTSGTSTASNAVTLTTTQWWELDPTTPTTAVNAQPTTWQPAQIEQSAAHQVMGQTTMTVIANRMMHQDFQVTFEVFTKAIYTKLHTVMASQKTVFVSSPFGDLDSGWFRIGPQPGGLSTGLGNKVRTATLHPSTATAPYRSVQATAVAQPRPSV